MPKLPTLGRHMRWENGIPVPSYGEPVTPDQMTSIGLAALAMPYEPEPDVFGDIPPHEEQYRGRSCLEVAHIKLSQRFASGDLEAGKFIYDRTIGKPKQHVEQVNRDGTMQDFLEQIRISELASPTVRAEVTVYDDVDYIGITKKETIEDELGL